MAFWGVEVKPGRPFLHFNVDDRGSLRLSRVRVRLIEPWFPRATLGIGAATERSYLQCNVGGKAPVLLCSLLPDRIESTCFDLEFEEKGEVMFSVLGPRSIHLAGYFIGGSSRRGGGGANESDSYGEDIWGTGSNESGSYHSSEDKYESDFIDDGDIEAPPSHRNDSGAIVEEIIEDEKPVNEKLTHRRLRKKHQISDSDEGDDGFHRRSVANHNKSLVSESEEEDGFPISFSMGNKDKENNIDGDVKVDGKILDVDKKRRLDVVVLDKDSAREDKVVAVSSGKLKKKKKDRIKSAKSLETDTAIPGENIRDKQSEYQHKYADDRTDEAQPCEGENEKVNQDHAHEVVVTECGGKPKKRKKEKVRRGETPETIAEDNQSGDQSTYADDKRDEAQPCEGENEKVNQDHAHEVVVTECTGKPKKRKKEKVKRGETPETRDELAADKFEEGALMEKIDSVNNIEQANVADNNKDPLIKSGHQGVPDDKEVPGSHDKLKRKKKRTKDKSSLEEKNGPVETSRKDKTDKIQNIDVESEASKSHKKRDKDQPVCGQPPEPTAANLDAEPVPADVRHEPNKKKQTKKSR